MFDHLDSGPAATRLGRRQSAQCGGTSTSTRCSFNVGLIINADSKANPFLPTPENLKAAQTEYEEHCVACHGLDGSGRDRFEADFYPLLARLTV